MGIRIYNLGQLNEAVKEKRSVIVPTSAWRKPLPAAFMLNLSGAILLKCFDLGMFIYEKGT